MKKLVISLLMSCVMTNIAGADTFAVNQQKTKSQIIARLNQIEKEQIELNSEIGKISRGIFEQPQQPLNEILSLMTLNDNPQNRVHNNFLESQERILLVQHAAVNQLANLKALDEEKSKLKQFLETKRPSDQPPVVLVQNQDNKETAAVVKIYKNGELIEIKYVKPEEYQEEFENFFSK